MKIKLLFSMLVLLTCISISAQPFYLRGAQDPSGPCDWNNTDQACQLIEQGASGIFEVQATASNGIWKIYNSATGDYFPTGFGNAPWIEPGVTATFSFNLNTGEVGVNDGQGYDICAPGEFSSQQWDNNTSMRRVDGINGSSYCIDVPVPGTYLWKPTTCGGWNTFDENTFVRYADSESPPAWTVTTNNNNDVLCVFYDRVTGNLTSSSVTLPVSIGQFFAEPIKSQVKVQWSTFSEINNDFFTLERSINGIDFETIEIIEGAGNSKEKLVYTYVDKDPFRGMNYYRLQQEDYDGKTTLSQIVSVEIFEETSIFIHPNPSSDFLKIAQAGGQLLDISIIDINGQMVLEMTSTDRDLIDIRQLENGLYTIRILNSAQANIFTDRFIKVD